MVHSPWVRDVPAIVLDGRPKAGFGFEDGIPNEFTKIMEQTGVW